MSVDFDPTVDYYKALGVDAKAKPDEIKRAYRKLAKQYHPDSTGGDKAKEQRFKEVSVAYDVLGDATQRAAYDEMRALGGGRARPGTGPFSTGGPGFGGSQVWDLGDLFSQMFAAAGPGAGDGAAASRGRGPARGGGRRGGRGARGADPEGWIYEATRGAGSASGGPEGFAGPPPGGPVVRAPVESKVQASDGSWLVARGIDVHSDVRVPFHHAILGTVAEVATLDGKASVKIPPGTSSGRRLRLRGKGVVGELGGPGDHYVTVHVDVPAELDDHGKQLLLELATHLAAHASSSGNRRK